MLVLFTGGRGSGKSTIARTLYATLDAENFDYVHQSTWRAQVNHTYQKIYWIAYFLAFFRPRVCSAFFGRLYRDIRHGRAKGSLSRIYMPCVFSYHLQRLLKNKEQCVIYDSDFFTWSADKVLDGIFDPHEVQDFYTYILKTYVSAITVVVCDTPVEDAVKRWSLRDNEPLSPDEILHWIEKRTAWKQAREKVIEVVSAVDGVKVVRLNGLDTPEENVHRIMTLLQKEL